MLVVYRIWSAVQAMRVVNDRITEEANEKRLKEIELASVKINKEDIDLIVSIIPIATIALQYSQRSLIFSKVFVLVVVQCTCSV